MTSHIKFFCILVFLVSFVSSFFYLSYHVNQNTAAFEPDEMYWIGTARIIPLLASYNTTDPFWKEYYGYANFNGSKLLYGASLWSLGYRDADFAFIGYQPDTFYQFSSVTGRFPKNNPHYPMLQEARMVHAFFASLSVGLFALLTFMLFGDILTAFLSAFILIVHPVFQSIATIAYADAFFLCFEIVLLVLLELYMKVKLGRSRIAVVILLGIDIAVLTAIQVNGVLFAALALIYILAKHEPFSAQVKYAAPAVVTDISVCILSAIAMFVVMHPNFFFPGAFGPLEVISGRVLITKYHMAYFSRVDPSHVLWSIPERLIASFNFLFQGSLVGLLSVLSGVVLLLRNFRVPFVKELSRLVVNAFYVYGVTLMYLVFNESRYLLPMLPFLILFSVFIFAAATKQPQKQ